MGIFIISIFALVGLDQLFKYLVATNLVNSTIENFFFKLTYFENTFIIGETSFNWLLILFSIVLLVIFIIFFFNQYAKKVRTKFNFITFTLIIAGGISNLIDRLARGFVIDYVELNHVLQGIVFNLADVCIVAGVVLLIGMYAIKITDDKAQTMVEGDKSVQSKSTKEWFKELFKGR